jgi:hypothetical protein
MLKVLSISCPCCGKKRLDILFTANDTEYVSSEDNNIVQIVCYACKITLLEILFSKYQMCPFKFEDAHGIQLCNCTKAQKNVILDLNTIQNGLNFAESK